MPLDEVRRRYDLVQCRNDPPGNNLNRANSGGALGRLGAGTDMLPSPSHTFYVAVFFFRFQRDLVKLSREDRIPTY